MSPLAVVTPASDLSRRPCGLRLHATLPPPCPHPNVRRGGVLGPGPGGGGGLYASPFSQQRLDLHPDTCGKAAWAGLASVGSLRMCCF